MVDIAALVPALRKAYRREGPLALHEPWFNGPEKSYLSACVDSTFVSSVGPFTERFEELLREKTGSPFAVAVVNGTAALHLALRLAGVTAGEEVLVPALGFVAVANAVSYLGATPHFIDSDRETFCVDAAKLDRYLAERCDTVNGECRNRETGRRIAALVAIHTFGFPSDLDPLVAVCQRYHLELIEDAAGALGSRFKGKHAGTFGKLGILSFNGNKVVTTGGGGAILAADETAASRARHLSTTAKSGRGWESAHDAIGYNYRMPNINAALGCAQLEQLEFFLDCKRRLASRVAEAVANVEGVAIVFEPPHSRTNCWLITLRLAVSSLESRDAVLERLHASGLGVRPPWRLLSELPMYRSCPRAPLEMAAELERTLLNIPSSAFLGAE